MKNKLRKALLERKVVLGGWIQIGNPAVAEVLASVGYDWLCVDFEHGAIELETATNIFRALSAYDCVGVARVPKNDPIWIRRSLDAGAQGLIVPMVNTAEEAKLAVQEAKYPPLGRRGFGYCRANHHGLHFNEYSSSANDEVAMIMQIEHHLAVSNLEAIFAVEGVDGVFLGPIDLSGSIGLSGQLKHPDVQALIKKYHAACRKLNVSAGLHLVEPNTENIEQAIASGVTLLALGVDAVLLRSAASEALSQAQLQLVNLFRSN